MAGSEEADDGDDVSERRECWREELVSETDWSRAGTISASPYLL